MTDTRIATDYLTGMFAMLAAKHINPAQVDWSFAAECWDTVKNENERLHQCIRNAAESTDSFMRASEHLGTERDELLKQRTKLISSLMQVASAVELELGKDFDTKSRIGLALSRAGKLLDLGGCDDR